MTEVPGFEVVPGEWAIARLPPDAAIPDWAVEASAFSSVTRTASELSIVCPEARVPEGARAERGWAVLKLAGPFAFTEVGVLASVLVPLARAAVSVFAVSTFDTDYVLVPRSALRAAVDALEAARSGPVTP
ncbi:MAG TPA: ACT domain-containing protein [Thermoanaerobaculia bacterium]|nr:ACT domain-containing protein [Thermoanaerobaculia bacterium]